MNFTERYLSGAPVVVVRPNGETMLVVGWIGRPTGCSFADDGILDDLLSGHFPIHHLDGEVTTDGVAIVCAGHRFQPAWTDTQVQSWVRLMKDRNVDEVRASAEMKVRRDSLARVIARQ
jgi:hypothetical protein